MSQAAATSKEHSQANVKETVESILVAFILAFIFRAFVVEAFVIPTGSMAPTLYGAHFRFQCPDCGYGFDLGYKSPYGSDEDADIPSEWKPGADKEGKSNFEYHCPNCGYTFGPKVAPVRFGDRILVLKYLYLFQKPTRWDVVVFKSPEEHNFVKEDPEYGMNFIKRLIAMGPESVVILDGDVYTSDSPDANQPGQFKIQRKPNYVQDRLWRAVYNNDFVPHKGISDHAWTQPWQEERTNSGWTLNGARSNEWPGGAPSRVFQFSSATGGGAITFNSAANRDTHPLTDFLAYDEFEHERQGWQPLSLSDLKLSCDYTRQSGDGALRLQLSKRQDVFTAEIKPGKVRLLRALRVLPDEPRAMDERTVVDWVSVSDLAGSAQARVELINVDYRVSLRINGSEVLATTDQTYSPPMKDLWEQEKRGVEQRSPSQGEFAKPLVRIDAQQQAARIEHVVVSRDIYYLSFSNPPSFSATVNNITHLNAGEYFVMGDNSFISGDARYWKNPINLPHEHLQVESGRVPERFMLGKAFFVYWPAGFRLPFVPVNAVPDFGEMRFIR